MRRGTAVVAAIVLAAQAAMADAPSEYVLKLTPQQLVTLSRALGAMPYAEVAELISSLQKQISEQQAPKPEATPSK